MKYIFAAASYQTTKPGEWLAIRQVDRDKEKVASGNDRAVGVYDRRDVGEQQARLSGLGTTLLGQVLEKERQASRRHQMATW